MIKVVFVFIVLSLSAIFAYLAMSNKKDEEIHLTPRPASPRSEPPARFGTPSATLRLATHALPHASVCFRVFPNSRTDSYDITRYAFVRGFGWFRHGEDIFNKIFKGYKFSKKTFFIFETFFRKKK
jgi:hypothetical protein